MSDPSLDDDFALNAGCALLDDVIRNVSISLPPRALPAVQMLIEELEPVLNVDAERVELHGSPERGWHLIFQGAPT